MITRTTSDELDLFVYLSLVSLEAKGRAEKSSVDAVFGCLWDLWRGGIWWFGLGRVNERKYKEKAQRPPPTLQNIFLLVPMALSFLPAKIKSPIGMIQPGFPADASKLCFRRKGRQIALKTKKREGLLHV